MGILSAVGSALGLGGGAAAFAANTVVPSFTIRQITGPLRRVDLTGRGLPHRPFQLTTKQRAEFVWLPGYTEATVTVLGGAEEPTSVNGWWKDVFIAPDSVAPDQAGGFEGLVQSVSTAVGVTSPPKAQAQAAPISIGGGPANSVRQVSDEVDSIVREGQIVEVIWGNDVRRGLLVEFEKRWHNVHDLEWTMKFEWSSRGEPQPAAVLGPPNLDAKAATLGSIAADLVAAAQDPKFSLVPQDLLQIQADLQAISSTAGGVTSLAEAIVTAALSPVAAVQQAVALASGLIGQVDDFESFVASKTAVEFNASVLRPPGFSADFTSTGFVGGSASGGSLVGGGGVIATPSGGLVPGAGAVASAPTSQVASLAAVAAVGFGSAPAPGARSFGEVLEAQLFVRGMLLLSRSLRQNAVQLRSQLASQARNVLLGVYTAKDGDELRKVSRAYYGTNDHWRDLLVYNAFATSTLSRGQVVLVPKVPDQSVGVGSGA